MEVHALFTSSWCAFRLLYNYWRSDRRFGHVEIAHSRLLPAGCWTHMKLPGRRTAQKKTFWTVRREGIYEPHQGLSTLVLPCTFELESSQRGVSHAFRNNQKSFQSKLIAEAKDIIIQRKEPISRRHVERDLGVDCTHAGHWKVQKAKVTPASM